MNRRFLMLAPLAALLAACASQPVPSAAAMPQPATVAALIARDPQLSTFHDLIVRAGLLDQLESSSPVTVFAPTNEAFRTMAAKELDALAADPARLTNIVAYHVVPVRMDSGDLKPGSVKTAQGTELVIARAGDSAIADDAVVQGADRQAANGVVYTIDRVLMPPRQ